MKLVEQHVEYDPIRFSRIATLEGMEWFYGGQANSGDSAVFVAEREGRVVGFAFVGYEEISYEDLAKNSAWLHDVFVDPSERGTAAGRALIDSAIEFARERGASKLLLWTAERNSDARGFFEHAGFVTTMSEMMFELTDEPKREQDE